MKYGSRHSDRCSPEELEDFKKDVLDFISKNSELKLKTRALRTFGGTVNVYSGKTKERPALRKRRRFFKKEGDHEIWEVHKDPIIELDFFPVYRTEWNSEDPEWRAEERESLKNYLKEA